MLEEAQALTQGSTGSCRWLSSAPGSRAFLFLLPPPIKGPQMKGKPEGKEVKARRGGAAPVWELTPQAAKWWPVGGEVTVGEWEQGRERGLRKAACVQFRETGLTAKPKSCPGSRIPWV